MKNLIFTIFTCFTFAGALAQYSNIKYLGDKAFRNKDYYKAAYYYKIIADSNYSMDKIPFYADGKASGKKMRADQSYIWYQLAESYRLNQNFHNAEAWYLKIITKKFESNYSLSRYWYAICLKTDSHFEDAIKEFEQFKTQNKNDKRLIDMADREIASCLFGKQQYVSNTLIKVNRMNAPLNADAGDYALIKRNGNYWFTSSRAEGKKHSNNIYSASVQSSFKPAIINFKDSRAEDHLEYGPCSVDASGNRMYLTMWQKPSDKIISAIYYAEFQNNTWQRPRKLNNNVNAEGFNALQPFVTSDGKRLFFAADKPGGEGGYDIWVSDLDSDGNPLNSTNLGKTVNTPFDEEAPYYDNYHKRLVYSSKGFTGLGGFDLFESFENNGQWSASVNLGYPLNSTKDDLYYYDDPDDKNKFYISSDRGSDCCLSLFQLHHKTILIKGKVFDCDSNKILINVKVSLREDPVSKINSTTNLKEENTQDNNSYSFELATKHVYLLVFEKKGYFTKSVAVNSGTDTLLNKDICLLPIKVNKPVLIKDILYDYNKASLRPESDIALDGIVEIMKDNPTIKLEISSHTDSIGNDAYNLVLSQQRAQSCVDYIVSKGIDKIRFSAKGYGKSRPVAPNSLPDGKDNPEGRQLNRRTEFTVKQ